MRYAHRRAGAAAAAVAPLSAPSSTEPARRRLAHSRADYKASVSLLTEAEREKLWNDAKAFCWDWLAHKIPATPANLAKFKKQVDIFTADCSPDSVTKLLDTSLSGLRLFTRND